jgi:hypothetical protein
MYFRVWLVSVFFDSLLKQIFQLASCTIHYDINNKYRVNDCCLMPTQQFFSYIMVRTS